MVDDFRKVVRGERLRIPARAYNSFIDAARRTRDREFNSGRVPLPDIATGRVRVQNNTGGAIDRFAVLGVSGVVIDASASLEEFHDRIVVNGVTPHGGLRNFVVVQEPLADEAIGVAVIHGATPVQVTVGGVAHNFAEMGTTTAALTLAEEGSTEILWREGGINTTEWAFVRVSVRRD